VKPDAATEARNAFANIPFTRLLGMRREYSEAGRARMVLDPSGDFGNAIGAVHGGVVLTLLDVAMASAAVSQRGFECTAVTLGLNASFIEPGHGAMAAEGEVQWHDDDIAICSATVTDPGGRVVARATGSFRYLRRP
jgi:uncharacterized protein (TIGR00369 family)